MSKTIAIRVSDDVHSALAAHCQAKGLTMTELLTPILLGLIKLPPTPISPLELRVMELETQLAQHKKCLDGVACELVTLYTRLDVVEDAATHLESCLESKPSCDRVSQKITAEIDKITPEYIEIPEDTQDEPKSVAIDLKASENLAEPEPIEDILSPVSSRDSDGEGNGTSDEPISNPDIEQAIIAVLKPYPTGGYYFRAEYLGQGKRLSRAYSEQAKKMGFVSKDLYPNGDRITGWMNRGYCLPTV